MKRRSGFLLKGSSLFCVACLLLVGLVFLPVSRAQATVTIVDHFTAAQALIVANQSAPGPTTTSVNDASIFGGWRHITLKWVSGPGNEDTFAAAHNLHFSSDSLTSGTDLIAWNGSGTPGAYALGQNLSSLGDRFLMVVDNCDLGVTAVLTVYTSNTDYSSIDVVLPPNFSTVYPFTFTLLFADFLPGVGATNPAVFNNVNRIELFIPGSPNLDVTIDALEIGCPGELTPTISQFYANPNPLTGPPPKTVDLCYQVSTPATVEITDTTHGGVVVGPVASNGTLVCVPGINVPSVPTIFTLRAVNACAERSANITVTFTPPGKVPSLTEWGVIILSLILAVSAVVLHRRKNTIG